MKVGGNEERAWPTRALEQVVDFFDHKRVPLSSRERQQRQGPYPYYGAQGIIDHVDGVLFDGRYILVAEDGENLHSRKLPLALLANGKFWVSNHSHVLRAKADLADDGFILACLNGANIQPYVTGAAQPKLSQANLRRVEIPMPPLPVQRRIAGILSAYDALIENDLRRIWILEEMARAVYREWFVHFRFPGNDPLPRIGSARGALPEAWAVRPLAEVGAVTIGGDWGAGEPAAESCVRVACLRGVDVHSLRIKGEADVPLRWVTSASLEKRRVLPEDVIVEGSGECGRSLAGDGSLEPLLGSPVIYSNFCKRIRFSEPAVASYVARVLNEMVESSEMQNYKTGTAIPNLNFAALTRNHPFVVPPLDVLRRFHAFTSPIDDFRLSGRVQTLRRTRDLLLPRLLSGQLSIDEAA